MYKLSQFNHQIELSESGNHFLYNFDTQHATELNALQALALEQGTFENLNSPFLQKLYDDGFLVEDSYNEYDAVCEGIRQNKANSEIFKLSIFTSMKCNFACEYCFEMGHMKDMDMSVDTQDKVIEFARKRLEERNISQLQVTWFGGEPLMNPEAIRRISKELISMAEEKGILYDAVIYTNGYLLTEENIRMLEECHVNGIRISIDGCEQAHDAMRHTKNGKGTYKVILENLKIPTTIQYRLRCNMTHNNIESYPLLVQELKEIAELSGNRITCIPERMRVERDVNPQLKEIELSYQDYYKVYRHLKCHSMDNINVDLRDLSRRKIASCAACMPDTFSVDVQGNLYRCSFYVGIAGEL